MKRILYICDQLPISPNYTGASLTKFVTLSLLLRSFENLHVDIVVLDPDEDDSFFITDTIPTAFYTVTVLKANVLQTNLQRQLKLWRLRNNYQALPYFFPFLSDQFIANFGNLFSKKKYTLVWTEGIPEIFLALTFFDKKKVVYSHHDLQWKIRLIRAQLDNSTKNKVNALLFRMTENRLLKDVINITCGTYSEIEVLKKIGGQKEILYLPSLYESVIPEKVVEQFPLPITPEIVHLGSLSATANKVGLKRFLEVCWPIIIAANPDAQFKIIGNVSKADDHLKTLFHQKNVYVVGFVEHLGEILQPLQIQIIPYEYDTGRRTRLPLILNYGQILISTVNACKGNPEIKHGISGILVEDLESMASAILAVLEHPGAYRKMAIEGKKIFEAKFSISAFSKPFREFMKTICLS